MTAPTLTPEELDRFLRELSDLDTNYVMEEQAMDHLALAVQLARLQAEAEGVEWDVWGGEVGQEDGDHWGTFGTFREAVEYKFEQETENPRLHLRIQRRAKQADSYADPFADVETDVGWRQSDFV